MGQKQMKKLRRAIRNAGLPVQSKEYFIYGKEKEVTMTPELRETMLRNISKINDPQERTEKLASLPVVGQKFKVLAGRHIRGDEGRRMYKIYKKVFNELKGEGNAIQAIAGDIERNKLSNPVGPVPSVGEGKGFLGFDPATPGPDQTVAAPAVVVKEHSQQGLPHAEVGGRV